jgi:transcriptional regulator with XRE-family HTH domain
MQFSQRLKDLRIKNKLNQTQLANFLNVGQRQVSYYESGEDIPPLNTLITLSNYFGVSLDYLTGRDDDPRYENFVANAEAVLISEAEALIPYGINAEVNSKNELLGSVGKFMINFYNSHKQKYTAPLARLRLIFATREFANWHLNPRTIKVHLITPDYLRKSSLLNPKAFLQERGILSQEVLDIKPLKAGEKTSIQLLIEELDKLEAEYHTPNRGKNFFHNPDGKVFYSFSVEDTMQPDVMKCKGITLAGDLKYTFGIFQDAKTRQSRHFLYLDFTKTSSIYPYLHTGRGHIVFLALVSFINWKLGFQYNPYNPGNMDLIIALDSEKTSKFASIGMTKDTPLLVSNISIEYCNFIEEYLNKTTTEKISYLSKFLLPNNHD